MVENILCNISPAVLSVLYKSDILPDGQCYTLAPNENVKKASSLVSLYCCIFQAFLFPKLILCQAKRFVPLNEYFGKPHTFVFIFCILCQRPNGNFDQSRQNPISC